MPLTAGVENVQDLGENFCEENLKLVIATLCASSIVTFSADDQSRAALVQQLADSIRTLRRVREAEKQQAATEEEKKQ